MSCYYKALPRLIPQLLLMARPLSEIILVSPWIDNVKLYPPIFAGRLDTYDAPEIRLNEFLLRLARDYDIRITLIIRERDYRSARVVNPLQRLQPENLLIREIAFLHAKAVVTEAFILETSANILMTSLFRNVELCTLVANLHKNPRQWLKDRLGITV